MKLQELWEVSGLPVYSAAGSYIGSKELAQCGDCEVERVFANDGKIIVRFNYEAEKDD